MSSVVTWILFWTHGIWIPAVSRFLDYSGLCNSDPHFIVTVVEIWYAGEGGARSWCGEKRRFSAWRLLWVLLLEISASSSFILLWEDSCSERKYSYDLNTGPVWWNCVQQGNVVWYSSGSWKTRLNLVPNLSCLKKVARCSLITDLFRSWKGLL